MSLRGEVVEAMAAALHDNVEQELGEEAPHPLRECLDVHVQAYRTYAEAALDAALDVLGDDGEGWHVEPQGGCCRSDLLAVLRAGKGSDE